MDSSPQNKDCTTIALALYEYNREREILDDRNSCGNSQCTREQIYATFIILRAIESAT